jgi:hypothetical protein
MRRFMAFALMVAVAACSSIVKPKFTKETVQPLLQKEAESLKADGEKMPDLGVQAIWNIAAVEVREQAGDARQPFAGTIRFRIESRTRDFDGPAPRSFEKKFEYVFDGTSGKWMFKP